MRKLTFLPVAVIVACAVRADGQTSRPARPRALVMAERGREALRTGELVWTQTSTRWGVRHHTSRFAGRRITCENRGDDRGVVVAAADGSVRPEGMRPIFWLRMGDQLWIHDAGALRAQIHDPRARAGCPDPRTLGMLTLISDWDVDDLLWRDLSNQPSPRIYDETIQPDGLHVVTAKTDSGSRTWLIDPARGWNPVRVTCINSKGKTVSDVRSTLARVDGVWFPDMVAQFPPTGPEGGQPEETIRVDAASFNRPNQPQTFGPADIGIEPGVQITVYRAPTGPNNIKERGMHWDGERLITTDEYVRRTADGWLDEGPTVRRELALLRPADTSSAAFRRFVHEGPPPAGPAASRPIGANDGGRAPTATAAGLTASRAAESQWEAYTRAFTSRHHLSEAQAGAARAILADCVAQLTESERSAANAGGATSRTPAAATQRAAPQGIAQTPTSSSAAADRIFQEQLKPRLDGLLTESQRAQQRR